MERDELSRHAGIKCECVCSAGTIAKFVSNKDLVPPRGNNRGILLVETSKQCGRRGEGELGEWGDWGDGDWEKKGVVVRAPCCYILSAPVPASQSIPDVGIKDGVATGYHPKLSPIFINKNEELYHKTGRCYAAGRRTQDAGMGTTEDVAPRMLFLPIPVAPRNRAIGATGIGRKRRRRRGGGDCQLFHTASSSLYRDHGFFLKWSIRRCVRLTDVTC